MTDRTDPSTGNVLCSGGGQIPTLTAAQRDQANYSDEFALSLLPLLDNGRNWFTAHEVWQSKGALDKLIDCGVITKHKSNSHDGHYYRTTPVCRAFCMCAVELRKERIRLEQERTG